MMETSKSMKKIKELKRGDFFKRKPDSQEVYVRGEYCREEKKYSCYKHDDTNSEIFLKGDKEVYVNFEF